MLFALQVVLALFLNILAIALTLAVEVTSRGRSELAAVLTYAFSVTRRF